jgi:ParB-like chromosome segregation protein Spo0J
MATLEFHELAGLFPMMTGDDAKALGDDIKANGQHEPIIMFEEKILDGRNRYLECIRVGVKPTFRPYLGDDPTAFVVSLNLKRRHLDETQRAMVAKKIETVKHGGDRKSDQDANLHVDRATAAKMLNVSERSVANASTVIEKGTPDLVSAVEQGKVSVSAAADFAKEVPPLDQARLIAEHGSPAKAVKAANADRRAASKRSAVTPSQVPYPASTSRRRGSSRRGRPSPGADLIDLIEQFERVNANASATVAGMSSKDRITLMTQIVRANSWLNKTAVEIAISGGANLGKLAPVSLRLEALEFLKAATARIEAELAGRASPSRESDVAE